MQWKRCHDSGTVTGRKFFNLFWTRNRSGLGFPPHGTVETQLNDALIAFGQVEEKGGVSATNPEPSKADDHWPALRV